MRIPNRPTFAAGAAIFTISILIYTEAVVSGASGLCITIPLFSPSCSEINPPLYLVIAVAGLLIVGSSFLLFRGKVAHGSSPTESV